MIGLRAALQHIHARIAARRDVADTAKAGMRQCERPRLHCLAPQFGVADVGELRQVLRHTPAQRVVDRALLLQIMQAHVSLPWRLSRRPWSILTWFRADQGRWLMAAIGIDRA